MTFITSTDSVWQTVLLADVKNPLYDRFKITEDLIRDLILPQPVYFSNVLLGKEHGFSIRNLNGKAASFKMTEKGKCIFVLLYQLVIFIKPQTIFI